MDPRWSHSPRHRLQYLDGLRGILCIIVVYHHFQCGFNPCHVFGPIAEWIRDPSVCKANYDTHQARGVRGIAKEIIQVFISPISSGPFAVACFFVMSGCALSINLLQESTSEKIISEKWRLAVAKRFFRLALPCFSSMIFAYMLAGFDFHQQASQHTQSMWLKLYYMKRPPNKNPFTALIMQSMGGIWHGSSTLNNAIWTMKIELFGSYLVYLLVVLIKDVRSPRRRTMILAGISIFMMLPSPSISNSLQIHLGFQFESDQIVNGTIVINPMKHSHIITVLQQQGRLNNISYTTTKLETWQLRKANNEKGNTIVDRHAKLLSIDDPNLNEQVGGGGLASQLIKSSPDKKIVITSQKLVQSSTWSSSRPYVWYVCFVAGVWIADCAARQQQQFDATPSFRLRSYYWLYTIVFVCASYPIKQATLRVHENRIWYAMSKVASKTGVDAVQLYYTLGASILVWLLAVCAPNATVRRYLVSKPVLFLGRISFSLYLTHIPILYTVTSALYVGAINKGWYSSSSWLNTFVLLTLTGPICLVVAFAFEQYVDRPSIKLSNLIGRKILGMDSSSSAKRESA